MDFFEDNPVELRKILDMLTVANEYCHFLEKCDHYEKAEVFEFLQKISPLLYLKGALLPVITPNDEDYQERFVTAEQYQYIQESLENKLNPDVSFTFLAVKNDWDQEGEKINLAENFADVYQDLKDFIMLYQKRTFTSAENAVSQCYKLFCTHWGPRLTEAMACLHIQLFQNTLPEE